MAANLTDTIRIAVAQLELGRRRHRRQSRQGARGARRGGGCRRRPPRPHRAVHRRLSARGPRAQARPSQDACRDGGRGARRAIPPMAARASSSARPGPRTARSTTPSRCSMAARIAGAPLQGRAAELRRLRRAARLRARAAARTGRLPRRAASACRSARTSGSTQVCECLPETGAELLIVPNGSPYRQRQGRRSACRSRSPASSRAGCR